jgi:hypothetical protein
MKTIQLILFVFLSMGVCLGQSSQKMLGELKYGSKLYFKDGKYGISFDSTNVNFEYDTITSSNFAQKNGLWGVINDSNNIIIPFEYEYIEHTWYDDTSHKAAYIVQKNGFVGTIDINNKVVIPFVYEAISGWCEDSPEGHYVIKSKKYGFINPEGKTRIPAVYEGLYVYKYNLIKAKRDGKYGIINFDNEVVIPFKYEFFYLDFKEESGAEYLDKFVVKKDGIWSYLNKKGEIIETNISDDVILKTYISRNINDDDFEYIDYCMVNKELARIHSEQEKELMKNVKFEIIVRD